MTSVRCGLLLLVVTTVGPNEVVGQVESVAGLGATSDAKGKTTRIELRFQDGSVLRATTAAANLEVKTRYGTLTIPFAELVRVRLQPRLTDQMQKQVADAIAMLGHRSFAEREAAEPILQAIGVAAIPPLRQATISSNAELRRRAGKILEAIEMKIPKEEQEAAEHDVVETIAFTVAGQVLTRSFAVESEFLGKVTVKLSQIESLRSLEGVPNLRLVVDASRYSVERQWLETAIEVQRRDMLQVTASGEIDLDPDNDPGADLSTPRGNDLDGEFENLNVPGTLIGRVGPTGKEFRIGEKYSGVQYVTGKLYLRIAPSPYDRCRGKYQVKVGVTRAVEAKADQ